MKKIVFTVYLIFFVLILFAQNSNPLRFEIPVRNGTDPINYISAGEQGICIFYPTINDAGKDSVSWSFLMTDNNLKEKWHKLVPMHEDVTFLKGIARNNAVYLLFHDTKRNKNGNIFVYLVIPQLQLITEQRSSIPDKAEVVDFEMLDENALIGYNSKKGQPGLSGFSLVSGEQRNFDITAEKDALLLDISLDTLQKKVFATYKVQSSSSKNHLFVNSYSIYGVLEQTFDFTDQQERRNINSAQYIPLGKNKGIVTGTYGYYTSSRRNYNYYDNFYNYYYNSYSSYYNRQQDYNANDDNTPVSDGYFAASLTNNIANGIKYYSFSDFNHAFKYMTDVSAIRAKMRVEKKKNDKPDDTKPIEADEKDKSLNLKIVAHEADLQNGQIIMASEAYTPEFHTVTRMSYDFYGRAYPMSYQVFDGFRYSNAFIAAFDSTGNMSWNNGMEMRDIITKYLNKKLNFLYDSDEIILYYNANNKVAFKTIKGSTVIENTTYTPISPKMGTDQPLEEYLGTIEHWYGDYFIATGYQTVKNNYLENNRRNVFYLNKLAFK